MGLKIKKGLDGAKHNAPNYSEGLGGKPAKFGDSLTWDSWLGNRSLTVKLEL